MYYKTNIKKGTFAWLGPKKLIEGVVFYDKNGAVDALFNNWADGQPDSGANDDDSYGNTEEDCLCMDVDSGEWYDLNCYKALSYFIVQFNPPSSSIVNAWNDQHDDSLRDDVFAYR
jgi:hypothetical protein